MSFADFFYLSAGVGLWIVVLGIVLVLWQIFLVLRKVSEMTGEIKSFAKSAELLKQGIQVGVLSLVSNLIGKNIKRGGELDERSENK